MEVLIAIAAGLIGYSLGSLRILKQYSTGTPVPERISREKERTG